MNTALKDKLKTLPRSPGVYFHKDKNNQIIYVGKAAVLKNRVRQYFQTNRDIDIKTQALVEEIFDTDWLETDSEIDALFLESEMVKRYMPRYNILLRDDKSQMFVRIDMKSEWPTVSFTRNPLDDSAEYFGPYFNGFAIKKALRYLRKTFPYYTSAPKKGTRPDLYAHIGLSPSIGTSSDEYKKSLKQLIRYIQGGKTALIKEIEKNMKLQARFHNYEQAAKYRNQLNDLKALQQRIMFGDKEFLDISKDAALSSIKDLFGLKRTPERIEGFDISHMGGQNVTASMVVFTNGVSDRANYRKFKMSQQRNDDYANIYEVIYRRLSDKNIRSWGQPSLIIIDGGKGQLDAALKARDDRGVKLPVISIAKKNEEIIVDENRSLVSNSKLQAYFEGAIKSSGVSVEKEGVYYKLNLHSGQTHSSGHAKNLRGGINEAPDFYEHITKLFQRIRDESHRFAVSYHTVLKRANQTKSLLDDIPGIGPKTRQKLIRSLGSMRAVESAGLEKLSEVVGQKKAQIVYNAILNK